MGVLEKAMKARLILFTHEYPPFHGGIGNYAQGLALAALGFFSKVTVVTPYSSPPQPEERAGDDNLEVRRYREHPFTTIRHLAAYQSAIRSDPEAHVHAMDTYAWKNMSLLNRLGSVPYTLTLHGSEIHSTARSLRYRLMGTGILFKGVQRIACNSRHTLDQLEQTFAGGLPEERTIAYPGLNPGLEDSVADVVPDIDTASCQLNILTVARIEPRKGHLLALDAISKLPGDLKARVRWHVVGEPIDSACTERLRAAAAAAPFDTVFHGAVTAAKLSALFKRSDVFLLPGAPHPSKVEGFGMVFIEAGRHGLPSISTAIGGIPEAVADNRSGLVSAPGDAEALAANLTRLLTDKTLRSRLGDGAREHARSFTWEGTARATFGLPPQPTPSGFPS